MPFYFGAKPFDELLPIDSRLPAEKFSAQQIADLILERLVINDAEAGEST